MSRSRSSGNYNVLVPRPSSPHHDPSLVRSGSPDSMNVPPEDLDFDPPPGRPRFYNSDFGGPQPGQSYADSFDNSTRIHSENPSFTALPVDPRASGYGAGPLYQQYHDDPLQQHPMSALGPQRDLSSPTGIIMAEKRDMYGNAGKGRKRTGLILAAIVILLAVAGAVIGVYFGLIKPHQNNSHGAASSSASPNSSSPSGSSNSGSKTLAAVSGGDGSKITTSDGTTFTYSNPYGGYWWSDPANPFANNAQAQSWTPPLNQSFKWGQDRIYGYVYFFDGQSILIPMAA